MSLVDIFDENPNFLRALNGYPTPPTKENTLSNPIVPDNEPLDPTQVVALEEANVGSSEETTYVETPEHQAAEQFLDTRRLDDLVHKEGSLKTVTSDAEALLALRTETGQLYTDQPSVAFHDQAIRAVQLEHVGLGDRPAHTTEAPETSDLFVVWFTKVLGNWKALVGQKSTTNYFEVTFNGAKNEVYVDRYLKSSNTVLPGEAL